MNIAILEQRLAARRRRNVALNRCRVWFPSDQVDFADLHNPEFSADLEFDSPHAYDTIVSRWLDRARLH